MATCCTETYPTTLSRDVDTHAQVLKLAERHSLQIYDALIVANALRAKAETLHSEDMHHGLVVGGTTICNPFA